MPGFANLAARKRAVSIRREREVAGTMKDLRGFLAAWERRGDLVRVKEPMEDGHEVFTILWELSYKKKSPVVVFENVKDRDIPIVANVFGTMNRFAMATGRPATNL